jgi:hypothetical protein
MIATTRIATVARNTPIAIISNISLYASTQASDI